VAARPDIDQRVEQLVSKGRWQVPGYKARTLHLLLRQYSLLTTIAGEIRRPFRVVEEVEVAV